MKIKMKMKLVFLLCLLLLASSVGYSQISGTVYRDFNANGVKENTATFNEVGLEGVTVKAYDSSGAEVGSMLTASAGAYSFTGLTLPVRLEFTGLSTGDFTAFSGSSNGTSVQFITAESTTANFGVAYPGDYCQADPDIVTTCFVNGSSTDATVSGESTVVQFPYTANSSTTGSLSSYPATVDNTGSVYGLAYDRTNELIYSAAFLKRHSSLKNDLGTIYATDPATNTTSIFATVPNAGTIPNDATRGLSDISDTSVDVEAFSLIGKAGLGDLDISTDGKTLYTVNLNTKELVTIDVATKAISNFPITSTGCINGEARPFGLGIYQDKVYVGSICSGESSGATANLNATVYEFDGLVFTSVFTAALDYTRGSINASSPTNGVTTWLPWTDDETTFFDTYKQDDRTFVYPQPLLSDIEFDVNGDMILGLMDRAGHQGGHKNIPPTINSYLYSINSGGDLLRAYKGTGNSWTLESGGDKDGSGTYSASAAQQNNEGPGGGEFYFDDLYSPHHFEVTSGGITTLKGSNIVASNGYDPYTTFEGGVFGFSNEDGAKLTGYSIFTTPNSAGNDSGTFGKANGLGDLELLCEAAPLEIGNRVWFDANENGVQDAGEIAIDGVEIELCAADGTTVLGSTTTASGGQWYFNDTNVNQNGASGLEPETAYVIKVKTALGSGALASYAAFTSQNSTASNGDDVLNDNDASASGVINYTTGAIGANDHSLDIGVTEACVIPTATASATDATCNGGTANSDATITIAAFTSGQRYQYSSGGTFGTGIPASITAIPTGGVIINNLANAAATYTVRIYDDSDDACFVDRVVNIDLTDCTVPCVVPDAGENAAICLPKTSLKLKDAPSGNEWVVGSGNPSAATIDASTGAVTGMTAVGIYTFTLQTAGDPTCSDDITITVSAATPFILCNDGSTSVTATADADLTDIVWFNSAGTQVGTGNSLIIDSNVAGLEDGNDWFYYTAKDANDCDIELCCPVVVITEDCCPTPNCVGVTVIED